MRAKQTAFARIGLIVAGIILAFYWVRVVFALHVGQLFTHNNYWGAPIGTITGMIVLIVLTPAWVWALFRYWNWGGHQVEPD